MKITFLALAALALAAIGLALWVRLAPLQGEGWHVDPATAPDPTTPNFARLDLTLPMPPEAAAERLRAVAAESGAVLVAGEGLHLTFVTRSRLMGYPDYTSVTLTEAEGGTRLQALARSRFGNSDMGVNRARMNAWRAALER
jgi:uncharacterized protein (DUF1499 family)